jgi:hypothetical protein
MHSILIAIFVDAASKLETARIEQLTGAKGLAAALERTRTGA